MTQAGPDFATIKAASAKMILAEILSRWEEFDKAQTGPERRTQSAREALMIAEKLYAVVAGWARDHLLSQMRATGRSGSLDERLWKALSAPAKRAILHGLLSHDPILPGPAGRELRLGLEALELGEVQPVLQPAKKGKHGKAHTLALLRLAALRHAAFRRGLGMTKKDATQKVADAFKCAVDTLLTWEKRLPKDLGQTRVGEDLEGARERGQTCRDIDAVLFRRGDLVWLRNDIDDVYGDEALRSVAKRYLIALKACNG